MYQGARPASVVIACDSRNGPKAVAICRRTLRTLNCVKLSARSFNLPSLSQTFMTLVPTPLFSPPRRLADSPTQAMDPYSDAYTQPSQPAEPVKEKDLSPRRSRSRSRTRSPSFRHSPPRHKRSGQIVCTPSPLFSRSPLTFFFFTLAVGPEPLQRSRCFRSQYQEY